MEARQSRAKRKKDLKLKPIAWTIVLALLTCLLSAVDAGEGRRLNAPEMVWRYSNLPPDGREEQLIVEKRQDAERRALQHNQFTKEELVNIISDVALLHGLEPDLLCAIAWTESSFMPYAVSSMGALGLMQLMPSTGRLVGVRNPMNPVESAEGAAKYLRWLLSEYDNDLVLALAAYNGGPGAVRKGGSLPPSSQTRSFVNNVLTTRDDFRNK